MPPKPTRRGLGGQQARFEPAGTPEPEPLSEAEGEAREGTDEDQLQSISEGGRDAESNIEREDTQETPREEDAHPMEVEMTGIAPTAAEPRPQKPLSAYTPEELETMSEDEFREYELRLEQAERARERKRAVKAALERARALEQPWEPNPQGLTIRGPNPSVAEGRNQSPGYVDPDVDSSVDTETRGRKRSRAPTEVAPPKPPKLVLEKKYDGVGTREQDVRFRTKVPTHEEDISAQVLGWYSR